MPDRRTPEPAVFHGFARGLLVFELPDQLTFCFTQGAGDVWVLSDRDQWRMAGQDSAQCDALLLAAAVLQGDFQVHITRVPLSQVWPER